MPICPFDSRWLGMALGLYWTVAAKAAVVLLASGDSETLARAVATAQAGDTLQLPPGTWEWRESVRLKSGLRLLGAGQDQTIIHWSGEKAAPFITLRDCEEVEIARLTLDGRERPLGQDGIRGGNCRRVFLHHLTIRNLAKGPSAFVHGIMFSGRNPTMEEGVTDSRISECVLENIGVGAEFGGGIRMAWGSARNTVERNVVRRTGRGGIFGDHSSDLVIRSNNVTGSGGEGLGIEIWGGCPRSLIEDNVIDHWLSVDQGNRTAVRRNIVGADDGTLKGYGIEIIASDVIVTDNVVRRGAAIGLSVSNKPRKNNVFWGYNRVSDCAQWGAQWQGESGGIARHYFYRCDFERTIRGDPRARYPEASGHGFRFNGDTRDIVFESCAFRDNGGFGVQFGGANVDAITFFRCGFTNNRLGPMTGVNPARRVEFVHCAVQDPEARQLPATTRFSTPSPQADFRFPPIIRAGQPARFECASLPASSPIVERLWDFNHGIAEIESHPRHTYEQPGRYRVTLVVWDAAGRGSRIEKVVEVLSAQP